MDSKYASYILKRNLTAYMAQIIVNRLEREIKLLKTLLCSLSRELNLKLYWR